MKALNWKLKIEKKKLNPILAVCIVVLAGSLLYLNRSEIHAWFKANHLLPEPEKLTELYFEDHLKLPVKVIPGTSQSFKFTIHNLEYETLNYPYTVYAQKADAENTDIIDKGQVVLKHDEYKTLEESFIAYEATKTAIRIRLDNKNQAIHFWLNNE